MELPHVPEPSESEVRQRVGSEEVAKMYAEGDGRIVDSWEIQNAVNSYLWENWKEMLEHHSIGWSDFQSKTKFANNTIESWANERKDWEAVLNGHAELLDAEFR